MNINHRVLKQLKLVPVVPLFNTRLYFVGTIGAAALLKNFLWFYIQMKDSKSPSMEPLQTGPLNIHYYSQSFQLHFWVQDTKNTMTCVKRSPNVY